MADGDYERRGFGRQAQARVALEKIAAAAKKRAMAQRKQSSGTATLNAENYRKDENEA